MPRAAYVCYFGLREPLVQTQVLPYLRELVACGVTMSLLTFEPARWDAESSAEWRERLRADGIAWSTLRYHKRPSLFATLYDIAAGAWHLRRERFDIVHGRSHVGAAIGALARGRLRGGPSWDKLSACRLIFDIRGLLAEEYVDSGNWRAGGLLFRLTKMAERRLLRSADGFVVLTEKARAMLFPNGASRPVEVIPCCVDRERFAAAHRTNLGIANRTVFVYAGALGGGSYVTRELAELLAVARDADRSVFALVLTQSPPQPVSDELERVGFTRDDYRVLHAPPEDVPGYLLASDVGLLLIRPSFARLAASPTKFAEYLAAGLPVIATRGIGDLNAQIEERRVGVLLRSFDHDAYAEAIAAMNVLRLDPELAARCRELSREYDLHAVGGARYRRLYDAVLHR
ncbi:MAG TPA: glycosyltransferase [Thermoanaerobaculia bacterium]|nr:glycosyltransferase [Thermoanaerobaculia bacterium]